MSDTVIHVENLSKRYVIGHQRNQGDGLRHVIEDALRNPWRWLRAKGKAQGARRDGDPVPSALSPSPSAPTKEEFWALKDVSFDIKQGEVVGIIGRNGAGKSTLLKILSRITEPTSGRIRIKGRVASLLEVGTGFHQELTGRENIFLNGAILGMSKAEIKRKFDEIVAFSEIEKFLDTPVKRYSSGMYVRLAFAVAAHLEPEILIVDEVLAVGDSEFQKKCLGKMHDVSSSGRTVLFVSHNMAAVQNLCRRGLFLNRGGIVTDGPTNDVLGKYATFFQAQAGFPIADRLDRDGIGSLRFTGFHIVPSSGVATDTIQTGDSVTLVAHYEVQGASPVKNVSVSIPFYDNVGRFMFMCWTRITNQDFREVHRRGEFRAHIRKFPLIPGRYTINLYCEVGNVLCDYLREAAVVNVVEGDFFGTGRLSPQDQGGFEVQHEWDPDTQPTLTAQHKQRAAVGA